jgi:hypothetical protein
MKRIPSLLIAPATLACVAVLLLLLVSSALAKPGVVVTRDGQRVEGEITEKPDQVVVNSHGVDTVFDRGDIASIEYSGGFDKEFHDRLSKLDGNDVKGRVELARWALTQKQYNAAHDVLEQARQIDPNSREVYDMEILVRSQARLDSQARGPQDTPATTRTARAAATDAPTTVTTNPPGLNQPEKRYLTPADINRIRQAELRSSDAGVGIQFLNQVERRYGQYSGRQLNQLMALKPVDKAIEILDKGDPSMKNDVRISTDPSSLKEYRTAIQPVVLNGCATANCHGSTKAGHLTLFNPAGDPPQAYTNFYILSQYQRTVENKESGPFGGAVQRKLIERTQGQRSLLAQYMLPTDQAEYHHPNVQGFNGVVRTKDDPKWRQVVDWMNHSLVPVSPDYGISYEIPNAPPPPPATKPATAPTTAPTAEPAPSPRR